MPAIPPAPEPAELIERAPVETDPEYARQLIEKATEAGGPVPRQLARWIERYTHQLGGRPFLEWATEDLHEAGKVLDVLIVAKEIDPAKMTDAAKRFCHRYMTARLGDVAEGSKKDRPELWPIDLAFAGPREIECDAVCRTVVALQRAAVEVVYSYGTFKPRIPEAPLDSTFLMDEVVALCHWLSARAFPELHALPKIITRLYRMQNDLAEAVDIDERGERVVEIASEAVSDVQALVESTNSKEQ